jgi:hypothetical protein
MSDPVSIGLGVAGLLPVILETIKAFRTIREGVKTARKCDKEIEQLERDLKIQRGRFRNECVLLLQHNNGDDTKRTQEMITDPSHHNWTDAMLETRLQERLKESYDLCRMIVERIYDVQQQLISDLDCFGEIRRLKAKVSTSPTFILAFQI